SINMNMDFDPDLFVLIHANVINATNSQSNDGGTDDASSFHTGGANHPFRDGHLAFIRNLGGGKGAPAPPDPRGLWGEGTRGGWPSGRWARGRMGTIGRS